MSFLPFPCPAGALRLARRMLQLAALALAFVTAPPAAAAAVSVNVQRHDDAVIIKARADLDASPTIAWGVLTDFDRYAEFIPHLRTSRVIGRDGAIVVVEQTGDAALWAWPMPFDVTYTVTEAPPYRLRSSAAAGALPALDSSYLLTPTAQGVRLDYAGRIEPRSGFFASIEAWAVRRAVIRGFEALANEIERASVRPGSRPASAAH